MILVAKHFKGRRIYLLEIVIDGLKVCSAIYNSYGRQFFFLQATAHFIPVLLRYLELL